MAGKDLKRFKILWRLLHSRQNDTYVEFRVAGHRRHVYRRRRHGITAREPGGSAKRRGFRGRYTLNVSIKKSSRVQPIDTLCVTCSPNARAISFSSQIYTRDSRLSRTTWNHEDYYAVFTSDYSNRRSADLANRDESRRWQFSTIRGSGGGLEMTFARQDDETLDRWHLCRKWRGFAAWLVFEWHIN